MSKIFIEESTLTAIGDAIRAKTGKADTISPLNMPSEISSITGGGSGGFEPIEYTMTTSTSTGQQIVDAINNYIGDNNGYFAILKDVNESTKTAYRCLYLTVQPERINALSNNIGKYSFVRLNSALTRLEVISSPNYACRASIGDTFVIYPIS